MLSRVNVSQRWGGNFAESCWRIKGSVRAGRQKGAHRTGELIKMMLKDSGMNETL